LTSQRDLFTVNSIRQQIRQHIDINSMSTATKRRQADSGGPASSKRRRPVGVFGIGSGSADVGGSRAVDSVSIVGGAPTPTSGSTPNGHCGLQLRVDQLLGTGSQSAAGINLLIRDLAAASETAAVVRAWDAMGGSKAAEPATWSAVETLHARVRVERIY
jgi:hypothetical protein